MNRKVRLSESQLHRVIKESVKKALLQEEYSNDDSWMQDQCVIEFCNAFMKAHDELYRALTFCGGKVPDGWYKQCQKAFNIMFDVAYGIEKLTNNGTKIGKHR